MTRVLVIEDHPTNRLLLVHVLRGAGYDVLQAADAETGLQIAWESLPDAIVTDIQLPGMDGVAGIRALRADPRTLHTPIIALTAHAMPGDEGGILAAGATAYLSKPVSYKVLLSTVAGCLPTT